MPGKARLAAACALFMCLLYAGSAAGQTESSVRAVVERSIVPEGTTISVLIIANSGQSDVVINPSVSGLDGAATEVAFSPDSLTLSADRSSASLSIAVNDNDEPQGSSRLFAVSLGEGLPSLEFTIPPNDLTAYAERVEFTLDNERATQPMAINTMPELRGSKSFIVYPEGSRLAVKTGLTPAQSPFFIELALSEGVVLGQIELLDLNIIHLDSWRPFTQPTAQAQLSAGGRHNCGIKADGAMACWGLGDNGRTDPARSPQGVNADTRFIAVSAGFDHSCGIRADNTMACWGSDSADQTDPASGPQGADANTRFLAVSAGGGHSCGIKADGAMACWGSDSDGQTDPTSGPRGVDADTRFLAVSAGSDHSCGIKADGAVACWGLGGNDQADPTSSPQGVDANTRFLAVSAGDSHTCGIKADGAVACWGDDSSMQSSPTSSPQGVDANTRFLAVSAGDSHTCGIKADGAVACWGDDSFMQSSPTSGPQGVDANTRFLAVSAGDSHTCGIKTDGAAACWGAGDDDRTGPPSGNFSQTPDMLRLAEQTATLETRDGEKAVRLNEVLNTEFLSVRLTLNEGETTTLKLFEVSNSPAAPATITLEVEEGGGELLNFNPPQSVISEAGEVEISVTAIDNGNVDDIRSIRLRLSIASGRVRTTPANIITIVIKDNDVYTIGFDREAITIEEGMSESARLSVSPTPVGDATATVSLSVSDNNQLTVDPPGEIVFSASSASFDVAITVTEDSIEESTETFTVDLTLSPEIPATLSAGQITVTVPANDQPVANLRDADGEAGGMAAENSPEGAAVGITARADNATAYTLSDDADGRFTIDGDSGVVTVAGDDALDFEDAATHSITVQASNANSGATAAFTVNVADVNEHPVGAVADTDPADNEIPESETTGARTGITLSAADGDGSAIVTYALLDSNGGLFLADTNTGVVTLQGSLNHERSTRHTIIARAMSDDGSSSTAAFTIDVIEPSTAMVRVTVERAVIPEGTIASVFLDAALDQSDLTINMAVSGLMAGSQTRVSLSPSSLTLSPSDPSASFDILVEDNDEPQGGDRAFNVDFATAPALQSRLSPLTFAVPPNDLTAHAERAEFTPDNERAGQSLTINTAPGLRDNKSFFAYTEDPRLAVKTGLVAPAQSPFTVELALSEGVILGGEALLSLNIIHLESWQPFARPTAQAQLSAGDSHSCAIKADGGMACWGNGNRGRTNPARSPQGVDADTRFIAVSAGDSHTCAIRADGRAACWGRNFENQLNPASAAGVNANTRFLALSAGDAYACGIRADNAAVCWGESSAGKADPASAGVNDSVRFLALSAGVEHACGIRANNTAVCWGNNDDGKAVPASAAGVNADTRFLALSAGLDHSCGIKADGRAVCWGSASDDRTDPTSADGVDADTRFLALSAGSDHSCGIKADGALACWGLSGNRIDPTSSDGVDANTTFLAVSVGTEHSCGIKADGAAACWGLSDNGRTSPPSDSFSRTPDMFRLAERAAALETLEGEEAVRLNEVLNAEFLIARLTLNEGETTTLALFEALNSPAAPATVTLGGGGERQGVRQLQSSAAGDQPNGQG